MTTPWDKFVNALKMINSSFEKIKDADNINDIIAACGITNPFEIGEIQTEFKKRRDEGLTKGKKPPYQRAITFGTMCGSSMVVIQNGIHHKFRVARAIGKGNRGYVYEAVPLNVEEQKSVALKLAERNSPDPENTYEHEISALHLLKGCPNVSSLVCYGPDKHNWYQVIVTFPVGTSMETIFSKRGCMDFNKVKDMITDMLNALSYMHRIGVYHRDIKPNNIIEVVNRGYFLIDFGLASCQSDPHEWKNNFCGTTVFLSRNGHQHLEPQAAKDDLESLFYSVVYLYLGGLPWECLHPNQPLYEFMMLVMKANMCNLNPELLELFLSYRGSEITKDMWDNMVVQI